MQIRKGVAAIIFKSEDVPLFLVLRRVLNWKGWEFVKGSIKNEKEESAILREIKEETSLEKVEIVHKFPEKMEYEHPTGFRQSFDFSGSSHTVFLVELLDGDIKLSSEHNAFRWLQYKEARKILTFENQRKFLDSAMKFLKRYKYEAT